VADPEISKRGARSRKGGGAPPQISKKKSHILGLKSLVLQHLMVNFGRKGGCLEGEFSYDTTLTSLDLLPIKKGVYLWLGNYNVN
jgi:hypothetical protein